MFKGLFEAHGEQQVVQTMNKETDRVIDEINNIEAGVEAGRDIGFGQPLGIMGTTGRSTGIHLHFEVLTGSYPSSLTAYNPLSFPPYIGLTAAY